MDTQTEEQPLGLSEETSPANFPSHHLAIKKWEVATGLAAILVIGGVLLYYYAGISQKAPRGRGEYSQAFSLVSDKISQSAAIIVRLPEGITINLAEAGSKISFTPVLSGAWSQGKNEKEFVFTPSAKLEAGKYYSLSIDAGGTLLSKDFFADEDPKVVAIFPNADTEAPEDSSITIVFNRPMVPLTTLDVLSDADVPVEISPHTD